MPSESAIVISANDGVGIIIKRSDPVQAPNNFGDSLVTKVVPSKLNSEFDEKCVNKSIGPSSAIVAFGNSSEVKKILEIASSGIKNYSQRVFCQQISMMDLSEFIGNEMSKSFHTRFSLYNPEAILATWSPQNGSEVYGINSNGNRNKYQAYAIGNDASLLMGRLRCYDFSTISTNQALVEALKALMHLSKGEFKFEVARISSETNGVYQDGTNELCELISKEAMKN